MSNSPSSIEVIFFLVWVFHFIVAVISVSIFGPDYNSKHKTEQQKEIAKIYNKLFYKNFPYLTIFVITWFIIISVYWLYYSFAKIGLILDAISLKTIAYMIAFSLGYICLFGFILKKEYCASDEEFRNKHPWLNKSIKVFLYSSCVLLGISTVHFADYTFDYSNGEEHIVTVTKSIYYSKKGSKGGTSHHYEIHFEPEVCGVRWLRVSPELQQSANQDDKLSLCLKEGLFGIPYFTKDKKVLKDN